MGQIFRHRAWFLLSSDPKNTLTGLYKALEIMRTGPIGGPTREVPQLGQDSADLSKTRNSRDSSAPVYPLLIAHEKLDAAVAAAYGWSWPLLEEEVLGKLLALNLERAG